MMHVVRTLSYECAWLVLRPGTENLEYFLSFAADFQHQPLETRDLDDHIDSLSHSIGKSMGEGGIPSKRQDVIVILSHHHVGRYMDRHL